MSRTFLRWIRPLSQFAASALNQRKLQTARNASEVERLDRIRHPEKYRGK